MHIIKSSHWPNPSQFIKSPSPLSSFFSSPPLTMTLTLRLPLSYLFPALSVIPHSLGIFTRERDGECAGELSSTIHSFSCPQEQNVLQYTTKPCCLFLHLCIRNSVLFIFLHCLLLTVSVRRRVEQVLSSNGYLV